MPLIQILQQASAKNHITSLCRLVENSALSSPGNSTTPCTKHQLEIDGIIFQTREAESLTLLLKSKFLTTGLNGSSRPGTPLQRVQASGFTQLLFLFIQGHTYILSTYIECHYWTNGKWLLISPMLIYKHSSTDQNGQFGRAPSELQSLHAQLGLFMC